MNLWPCNEKISVLKAGRLEIQHIAGTTNGTVISKEAETTVTSTIFGVSVVMNTGAGTKTGVLTGATSSTGQATIHAEGEISMGMFGTADLSGTFVVTQPTGLVVEAS